MSTTDQAFKDHRKSKLLNAALLITSLIGYLEWSGNSHMFLFQAEAEVIIKLFTDPESVIHPFILMPLAGQILLLFTLFQRSPGKVLTYISLACLGLLLGFMFIIGLMSANFKIVAFAAPFVIAAVVTIRHYRKKGSTRANTEHAAL